VTRYVYRAGVQQSKEVYCRVCHRQEQARLKDTVGMVTVEETQEVARRLGVKNAPLGQVAQLILAIRKQQAS
jgi:RNA polymerase subunit RPABC4/transcription elongation factor Spt4